MWPRVVRRAGIAVMNASLWTASVAFFSSACAGERGVQSAVPVPADARLEETRHRVEAWLVAQEHRDFDGLAAAYTEGAIAESPGPEGWDQATGRALIREWAEKQVKWIPDSSLRAMRVSVAPGIAFVEYVMAGTNTGPMWDGGPSTGRKIGLRGCNVLTFDERGLITRERSYLDTRTMFTQLGKVDARVRPFPPEPANTAFLWLSPSVVSASADWARAWSTKDVRAYGQLLAEGAIHEDIAEPDDVSGRAANVEELAMFARAVPDMTVTTRGTWAAGSVTLVEYVLSGTQQGEFRGIPPTGRRLTIHALDGDETDGARIVKRTTYTNSAEWREQLGTLPKHTRGSDEPASNTAPDR